MTLQALAAGSHVLVEKPLAATMEQANLVGQAEARSGRRVFVAFQDTYNESTHRIKRLFCAGGLGPVRRIAITGQWARASTYYGRNPWAGRLVAGGRWVLDSPVNNAFAHYLNLALFWGGTDAATSAVPAVVEGELYRSRPIESFDTAAVRVTTATGVRIGMFVTHSCALDRTPKIVVEGTGGQVTWIKGKHYEICRPGGPPERHALGGEIESTLTMGDAVVRHVGGYDTVPVCGIEMARQHTLVVGALHQVGTIRDIPAEYLVPTQDAETVVIQDIDRVVTAAGEQLGLFSELGVPWAAKGGCCRREEVSGHPPREKVVPP